MYTLAFADMVVGDWFGALWLNLLFWMVLGSAGMYFFVKEWGGPLQGLLAGVTYAIVPQHLNEIFQFFLYAEFAAWGITPFCFLFVTRICRNGTWKDVVLFSISYSLLILTHIPTTIIISFCLPVYVLIVLDWRNFKPIAVRLAGAIGLTLAATSFRLVTLAGEYNLLAHNNEKYANGFFEYAEWLFPNVLAIRNHFLYVLTSWLFDLSIVMTVCLTIPAIIWLAKTYDTKSESIWRIQAAAVATTGNSSTRPVSKNSGSPMTRPATNAAVEAPATPDIFSAARASPPAPSDNCSIAPSARPSETTRPVPPRMSPTPFCTAFAVSAIGMPDSRPTAKAPQSNATNG